MKGVLLPDFAHAQPPREVASREDADGWVLINSARGYTIAKLACVKAWTPSVKSMLLEHQVDGIDVWLSDIEKFGGLAFLRDIKPLRLLTLHLDLPVAPLEPICAYRSLEKLSLPIPTLSSLERFDWHGLDFRRLRNLVTCSVTKAPKSTHLFSCESIRSLQLGPSIGMSGTIDVSRLSNLKELVLEGTRAKDIVWGQPRPVCLALDNTPKLRIDWSEVASRLQYLRVCGNINFDLSELVVLKNLRILELMQFKKFPDLKFLFDMPKLKAVNYRVPCGPSWKELSKANREIISEINARNGYERDWSMSAYKQEHIGWE